MRRGVNKKHVIRLNILSGMAPPSEARSLRGGFCISAMRNQTLSIGMWRVIIFFLQYMGLLHEKVPQDVMVWWLFSLNNVHHSVTLSSHCPFVCEDKILWYCIGFLVPTDMIRQKHWLLPLVLNPSTWFFCVPNKYVHLNNWTECSKECELWSVTLKGCEFTDKSLWNWTRGPPGFTLFWT